MILVGTRAGLFRVSDTGGHWSAERLLATDKPIMSLAVDATGETICVGFYQGGMCASSRCRALVAADWRRPAPPGRAHGGAAPD